jgi:hypothetical protein
MVEQGTFPEGLLVEGRLYREFILDEQKFRHTLEIMNDPTTGNKVEDPTWYSAALLVLDLSGPDGDELTRVSIDLENRRQEFRSTAQAAAEASAGAVEAGVQSEGD